MVNYTRLSRNWYTITRFSPKLELPNCPLQPIRNINYDAGLSIQVQKYRPKYIPFKHSYANIGNLLNSQVLLLLLTSSSSSGGTHIMNELIYRTRTKQQHQCTTDGIWMYGCGSSLKHTLFRLLWLLPTALLPFPRPCLSSFLALQSKVNRPAAPFSNAIHIEAPLGDLKYL